MKQYRLWVGLLLVVGLNAEDFITDFEYGQMLYRDPHGASCAACHGETGAGRLIGDYVDTDGHTITLRGSDIRHATLTQIRHSVQSGRGVMPRYFLTEQEIGMLHAYLQKVNQRTTSTVAHLFESTQSTPPETNTSEAVSDRPATSEEDRNTTQPHKETP